LRKLAVLRTAFEDGEDCRITTPRLRPAATHHQEGGKLTPSEIIDRIAKSKADIFITALTPEDAATFGSDNMEHFPGWAGVQLAKIANPERAHGLVLIVRELTRLRDPETGLPIKRVGGCRIDAAGAHPLSAAEMRAAHGTDADTGRERGPEPHVAYVSFEQLLRRL
jgi:hypothetical protein